MRQNRPLPAPARQAGKPRKGSRARPVARACRRRGGLGVGPGWALVAAQALQQGLQNGRCPLRILRAATSGVNQAARSTLRKLALATRARRPLHRKGVAGRGLWVSNAPSMAHTSTILAPTGGRRRAPWLRLPLAGRFLPELAPRGGKGVLTRLVAPFGDGPSAVVLVGPVTARPDAPAEPRADDHTPIKQNAGAMLRHSAYAGAGGGRRASPSRFTAAAAATARLAPRLAAQAPRRHGPLSHTPCVWPAAPGAFARLD